MESPKGETNHESDCQNHNRHCQSFSFFLKTDYIHIKTSYMGESACLRKQLK